MVKDLRSQVAQLKLDIFSRSTRLKSSVDQPFHPPKAPAPSPAQKHYLWLIARHMRIKRRNQDGFYKSCPDWRRVRVPLDYTWLEADTNAEYGSKCTLLALMCSLKTHGYQEPSRQSQRWVGDTHVRHHSCAIMQRLRERLCGSQQATGQDGLQHWVAADWGLPCQVEYNEEVLEFQGNGRDDCQGNT